MLMTAGNVGSKASPPIIIGIDIGQRHDPTAVAVAEAFRQERAGSGAEYAYTIRHFERLELGTPYPDVSKRVTEIVGNILSRPRDPRYTSPQVTIAIDITGVGRPVCDILRRDLKAAGHVVRISEVTFTHGDRLKGRFGASEISLGKAYLVSRLQALFQTQRIEMSRKNREAAAMRQELMDYEIKITEDANDKYGAFRVGSHDDLVTALGLAVMHDPGGRGLWAI